MCLQNRILELQGNIRVFCKVKPQTQGQKSIVDVPEGILVMRDGEERRDNQMVKI